MSDENQNKKVMSAAEFFAQNNLKNDNNTEKVSETNNVDNTNNNENINNTSGKGSTSLVPDVVAKKFNWGAFLLSWIWGLGNNTYITLLIFAVMFVAWIPIIGWLISLGVCIWFGIKGNEWAWQNKHFESVNAFHQYQKKWGIAGVIVAVIFSVIIPIIIFTVTFSAMFGNTGKYTNDYKTGVENVGVDLSQYENDYKAETENTDVDLSEYEKDYNAQMKKFDDDLAKAQKDYEEQMAKVNAMLKEMEQKN